MGLFGKLNGSLSAVQTGHHTTPHGAAGPGNGWFAQAQMGPVREDEVPVPEVTAPRPMLQDQSTPFEPGGKIPWWVSPLGRAGQEIGEEVWDQTSSGDVVRQLDGSESTMHVPTGGPGQDHTAAANGRHTYIEDMMNQGIFPTIVPDTHRELMGTAIPQEARDSLDALGEDVHDPYNLGAGDYNIDEYSMLMDELPPGYDTPEEFLNDFLADPNGMANDQSRNPLQDFDFYNEFHLNEAGTNDGRSLPQGTSPDIGDWYHIAIPGNDGDVMIVDAHDGETRDSATVQTMTDGGEADKAPDIPWWLSPAGRLLQEGANAVDPTVDHPVSGRRQFGMEQLEDGRYRFYTRGFDRQTNGAMDPQLSNGAQDNSWNNLMDSMAAEHGGYAERTDENGDPIWGWAQQLTHTSMVQSMEANPQHDDHLHPNAPEAQTTQAPARPAPAPEPASNGRSVLDTAIDILAPTILPPIPKFW